MDAKFRSSFRLARNLAPPTLRYSQRLNRMQSLTRAQTTTVSLVLKIPCNPLIS